MFFDTTCFHAPGRKVAIKKVSDTFADVIDAKRILRELKLLRHLVSSTYRNASLSLTVFILHRNVMRMSSASMISWQIHLKRSILMTFTLLQTSWKLIWVGRPSWMCLMTELIWYLIRSYYPFEASFDWPPSAILSLSDSSRP